MSHRNSAAAVISMLQKTDCHRILTTPRFDNPTTDALMDAIRTECPPDYVLNIDYIPHPDAIYSHLGTESDDDTFEAYPPKTRLLDDVALYLHSSGSTGFPKPIPESFRALMLCSKMGK
jgi:acyl-coenzyme A synthetase/AMP-(fatty) acid ligase